MNRKILLIIIVSFSILGILAIIMLNPSTDFNKINISQEEWDSIISTRNEGNLFLKTIKFNDYDLIIDEENNKIYYSVIKNSKSKFSPLVSYSANASNVKIAVLEDEITEDKIMNNHEFKIIIYDDNSYRIYGLYCTSFPMLNIVYDEQDNVGDFNLPISMYLFSNFDSGINRIIRSDGMLNKNQKEDGTYNYKFSLTMTTPGNNERENVISLLHMRPSNEYFLNAINIGENTSPLKPIMNRPKDKKDRLNNKNDISGDDMMNDREKNEQRVELFINNKYIGLYSLSYDPDVRIRPRNK